ncbi:MAG: hypothetical protein R2713_01850 [Ilumatobacteraceae bacterium]
MMESVEDAATILGGMAWDWETYPEYLDAVQRMAPALNVVGTGPLRDALPRDGRAIAHRRAPHAAELERMRAIAEVGCRRRRRVLDVADPAARHPRRALRAGHAGPARRVPRHRRWHERRRWRAVPGGERLRHQGRARSPWLREMARSCGDVLFSGGAGNGGNAGVDMFQAFLADVNANDGRMTLATQTRPSGSLCGLAQVSPVKGKKWKAPSHCPRSRREWPR